MPIAISSVVMIIVLTTMQQELMAPERPILPPQRPVYGTAAAQMGGESSTLLNTISSKAELPSGGEKNTAKQRDLGKSNHGQFEMELAEIGNDCGEQSNVQDKIRKDKEVFLFKDISVHTQISQSNSGHLTCSTN